MRNWPSLLLILLFITSPAFADVTGKARIIDGDTIEVGKQRIRLHGVDAPEIDQTCEADGKPWRCGQEATWALTNIIGQAWVTCTGHDKDRYRRVVAICMVGGRDIGEWMVSEGWALAYRKFSADYVAAEDGAKDARKGMWRGKFSPPWTWRCGERFAYDNRECVIKGNISKDGALIYHIPGSPAYGRTKINKASGERWFCSEEEAVAAGWRKPRR